MNTPTSNTTGTETLAPVALPDAAAAPAPPATETSISAAELEAENAALRQQVVELAAKKAHADAFEQKVLAKIDRGLKRPAAEAVVRRQEAFDASPYGKMCAARYAARQARGQAA